MLTAEAQVTTDRAARYLAQLCEHGRHVGHQRLHRSRPHDAGAQLQHAEWADSHGVLTFDVGLCTLDATEHSLIVHVAAEDADSLRRIQDALSQRLQLIGRRDQLVVTW